MLKIGIDGNEANIKERVGVNKYAFEIIWGIYRLLKENPDLIVIVYLKSKPLPDMPDEQENFKYKILKGGKVWIVTKLMPYLFKTSDRPDVFFSPSHYVPPFCPVPRVCSIMDVGYLEFSGQFRKYDYWQLKLWSAWSINVSKYIMTISQASQEDIVRHYPSSKEKIVVTYPGYDSLEAEKISFSAVEAVKKRYSIVKDYILYLGTLKPNKNLEGLISAWGKIVNKYPNFQLVIAGKKGWLYESIFKKVGELGLKERVVFTDFVIEKDKAPLIRGARLFVLPSFWEGFGLDVLTAYNLGVAVVASDVGSLPEVVGDAGILVGPNDINSIASGIDKVLDMKPSEYDKLISKGREQLKKFSWDKAARKTLEVLKKSAR